jgi:hypothetical protein
MSKLFEKILREGPGSGVKITLYGVRLEPTGRTGDDQVDMFAEYYKISNYDNAVFSDKVEGGSHVGTITLEDDLHNEEDLQLDNYSDDTDSFELFVGGGYTHSDDTPFVDISVWTGDDIQINGIITFDEEIDDLWKELWDYDHEEDD